MEKIQTTRKSSFGYDAFYLPSIAEIDNLHVGLPDVPL